MVSGNPSRKKAPREGSGVGLGIGLGLGSGGLFSGGIFSNFFKNFGNSWFINCLINGHIFALVEYTRIV